MGPNRYDLILLFAVVSGIYYVIDETLNNAPPRRTAETLPVVFSVDASPEAPLDPHAARAGAAEALRERGRTEEMGARGRCRGVAPRRTS